MTTTTLSRAGRGAAARGRRGPGTATLLRFMLRRDRIRFPAWTLGLTLLMTYFATALDSIVQSPQDLEGLTAFTGSPAGALFGGPGFGFDDLTLERFLAGQYGLYVAIGAGLMGLLTVVRHTRAEERSGRAELIRANVVGRHAQLTAALTVTAAMAVLVALLIGAMMPSRGYDPGGSLLFGASVGAVALAFAGIATVTVQLSEYPRAASGTAGALLGAAFVLRGLGDMAAVQGNGPPGCPGCRPIGWSQQTAPYVAQPVVAARPLAGVCGGHRRRGLRACGAPGLRRRAGAGPTGPAPGRRLADRPVHAGVPAAPGEPDRLERSRCWSPVLAYGSFTQPLIDGFADAPDDMVAVLGGSGNLLAGYLAMMGLTMALVVGVYASSPCRRCAPRRPRGGPNPCWPPG